MTDGKEHQEVMIRLAVLEEKMTGRFDSILNHLTQLNSKTSKNEGAISHLQDQDREIFAMVTSQKEADEARELRNGSWRKSWQTLLFGTLQWIIPALIIGLLINGKAIAKFFGFI